MDSQSVIKIGLGQLLAGILVLCGGAYAVGTFLLGDVRDNINHIKHDISQLRDVDTDNAKSDRSTEGSLGSALAELNAQLRVTNERLVGLDRTLGQLDASVREINVALIKSIQRQEDFEQWVMVRLGSESVEPTYALPESWGKNSPEFFKALTSQPDPRIDWFNALSARSAE